MNSSDFLRLIAEDNWQNQYTDTGWFGVFITLLVTGFVLFNIYRAVASGKKGKDLYIRKIAGLNAIDEAVGRATEMGSPVLMVPGLNSNGLDAIAIQALNIFSYVTRLAAKFANPILICCANAAVYTVAQEIIRDVYQSEGLADRYDTDSVRFLSDRQFAFAASVSGLILRNKAAATFFMGDFYAESLIFAETANSIGAIQIASSTEKTQTPFFIAACDYVLIGDEFYAASAYLTRQPILVGSLTGQDWAKLLIIATVACGAILTTTQRGILAPAKTTHAKEDAKWSVVPERDVKASDTTMSQLFNPQADPSLKDTIKRDREPQADSQSTSGGGS